MSRTIGTPIQQPTINAIAPAVLAGVAAAGAIAINDLLELTANGQLATVKVADFAAMGNAGATLNGVTTVSPWGMAYANSSPKKQALVNPTDLSYFVVDSNTHVTNPLTANAGMQVWKYSLTGQLLATVTLDTNPLRQAPQIDMLSNGNLVVMWASIPSGDQLNYAILDQYLNVVKAATVLATYVPNPGPNFSLAALTGGGFAAAWTSSSAAGVYAAILTNTGGATLGPTPIAGVPAQTSGNSAGAFNKLVSLSNGNIALAVLDTNAKSLGYMVFSPIGSPVAAYTAVQAAAGSSTNGYPHISVLPGFFAVSYPASSAAVVSNTGAIQGAVYAAGGGVLANDGTNFWLNTGSNIVKMPTSGAGYVATVLTGLSQCFGMFYDNGFLVGWNTSTVFSIPVIGGAVTLAKSSFSVAGMTINAMIPVGDCTALAYGQSTATNLPAAFAVIKHSNTAVLGVAQSAVAAGNVGAALTYTMGPGGYSINPVAGTQGKSFDHSATNLVGNKGTMLGAGVSLKGI